MERKKPIQNMDASALANEALKKQQMDRIRANHEARKAENAKAQKNISKTSGGLRALFSSILSIFRRS